jgi:hypothetical protein
MLRAGRFSYQNHYAMTLYSPGVIALGAFFGMLAFLPPASFIQRLSTKDQPSKNQHRRTKSCLDCQHSPFKQSG